VTRRSSRFGCTRRVAYKQTSGRQPHWPFWHWQLAASPHWVVFPCVHAIVQKFVVVSPMVEQSVAPELPRQSMVVTQYLPTPSALPMSPGCPQCTCSGLSPEASRGPLSAWPGLPDEPDAPELAPDVPEELPDEPLVPDAPDELPDEPLVPELLLVPDEPVLPELELEPELEDEQAIAPRRHTALATTTRFMAPSHL
jgi:hypothetical protein